MKMPAIVSRTRNAIDPGVAKKAVLHLLVAGFASISPLVLTAVIFPLVSAKIRLGDFLEHGEAGICAVGVLLGAGVLVARELTPPFRYRLMCFLFTIGLWTLAVLLYACVRMNDVKNFGIDKDVLVWMSVVVWSLSLVLSVIVVWIDAVREKADMQTELRRTQSEQFNSLKTSFEESRDE
jgi:hypothetical protein